MAIVSTFYSLSGQLDLLGFLIEMIYDSSCLFSLVLEFRGELTIVGCLYDSCILDGRPAVIPPAQ
jgi:hypothetical protein